MLFLIVKVSFLAALELEYVLFTGSSPNTQMSDGEGNRLGGCGVGGVWWGDMFEDISCHRHEENPVIGTRWQKMPELLLASDTRDRAASKQLSHVEAPILIFLFGSWWLKDAAKGTCLFGQVSSHTLQDPRACAYWIKVFTWSWTKEQ